MDKFIYKIHKDLAHRNHNIVRQHIIKQNIYFKGITNKIKSICKSCPICNIKLKAKFMKREKVKLTYLDKTSLKIYILLISKIIFIYPMSLNCLIL